MIAPVFVVVLAVPLVNVVFPEVDRVPVMMVLPLERVPVVATFPAVTCPVTPRPPAIVKAPDAVVVDGVVDLTLALPSNVRLLL